MMNRVFSYGLSILSGCILAACSTSPEAPYSLMCEYLSEPLGIDMSSPRLSWKIPVVKTDSVKSCRVWVSADSMAVINGSGQCWDSGFRVIFAGSFTPAIRCNLGLNIIGKSDIKRKERIALFAHCCRRSPQV